MKEIYIIHYNMKLARGEVVWPRRNHSVQLYDV